MDDTSPRQGGGVMKPVILRVCVALVLSGTGLIFARFLSRKEDNEVTSSASNPESSSSINDGEEEEEEAENIDHQILRLNSRFEEMELRFKRYCNLKDQEVLLMEHKSMLSLEKSQLDFFRREVSAMEEEHKRGQALVIVYLKLVGEIQGLRSKNGLLKEKAKKLRRRGKRLYGVVNEKSRRITIMEKEFLRCLDELEMKNSVVKKLEEEVKVIQEEKEEVYNQFTNLTKSEMVSAEDYRKILEENEKLKKEFEKGVKEVISLKWKNACLRYNEIRNVDTIFSPNENLQELGLEDHADALALIVPDEHHEENNHHHDHDHHDDDHHHESSKRKRLMKKLKRWVEGNDKEKSTPKSYEKCFGKHYLSVEQDEEHMFQSRRSCSSV